jgi:hypothetical protein
MAKSFTKNRTFLSIIGDAAASPQTTKRFTKNRGFSLSETLNIM